MCTPIPGLDYAFLHNNLNLLFYVLRFYTVLANEVLMAHLFRGGVLFLLYLGFLTKKKKKTTSTILHIFVKSSIKIVWSTNTSLDSLVISQTTRGKIENSLRAWTYCS